MARVFRKKRVRYVADGRRVTAAEAKRLEAQGRVVEKRTEKSRKWYIRYRLPDGRVREVCGYTDKMATQALAVQLQRNAAREAAGLSRPADTYLADPVTKHLADYQAALEARGRTAKHIRGTLQRIRAVLSKSGVRRLGDVTSARVVDALLALRQEGLATETVNHYLTAIKMFCRWLWRQGRLTEDPLAGLSKWNADADRRVIRRALRADELGQLIRTAEASTWTFRGLDGHARAALYVMAAYSGLRVSELKHLTAADLNLTGDPPTLAVRAAYAKNRKQDVLPLPGDAAEYLAAWLASRPIRPVGTVRLWPGSWWQKAAQMLKTDLKAAGIASEVSGQVLDFHALRATYATLLARQGINLQTAQALLRHSDPKLTARTYTKLGITDLGQAVAGLALPQLTEGTKAKGAET
ncbi:hypothetical protein JCM19992_34890 [Thermostilla marina]